MLDFDKKYFSKYNLVAGIDEAGRGPLAGPVIAAAVIFDKNMYIEGVNDSKKISPKKRDLFYEDIINKANYIGIGVVHADEIDELNILNATKKAMKLSVLDLGVEPELLLIDGNQIEFSEYKQESIIKGDSKSFLIASASIIAKVTRDRMMNSYAKILPEYGFDTHKGYGTKKHFKSIVAYKSSIIHRKTFNPVNKHLPSFGYYTKNNIINKLLIQIAGDYLIKNYHSIVRVEGSSIYSIFGKKEYCFYINSNMVAENLDSLKTKSKYINKLLVILFKNGKPDIQIDSI